MEDKDISSTFNDIVFKADDGSDIIIATTRPELIPAIVAIFAHPDDKRYQHLFGKKAKAPLFDIEIPWKNHIWSNKSPMDNDSSKKN